MEILGIAFGRVFLMLALFLTSCAAGVGKDVRMSDLVIPDATDSRKRLMIFKGVTYAIRVPMLKCLSRRDRGE